MLTKKIFLIYILLLSFEFLHAQCSCTDCPVNTISNGTVTSTINISGASSNTLGSNGQELRSIYLDYDTDAINEVNVRIIAPNGSFVFLIQNSGINIGQGLNFKICFNYCDGIAIPDPGFSEIFDSNENWQDGNNYGGSYYPSSSNPATGAGCLESLTGSVNGNWVLEIQDVVGQDDGVINDWFLVFADNSGTTCTDDLGCALAENPCLADGGELDMTPIETCEGDPILDITLLPDYPNGSAPDPAEYGYIGVISNTATGEIIEYSPDPNLITFPPGTYELCGLSYLLDDFSDIPPANGTYTTIDLTNDIDNDVFCGDLSDVCTTITIFENISPILDGPTEVCAGELEQYFVTNPTSNSTYLFYLTSGTFSFADANFNIFDIILETGPAQICVDAVNSCGTTTDCIDVEVIQTLSDIVIEGPTIVCQDEQATYAFAPFPEFGESYDVTVTGGILEGVSQNTAIVSWTNSANGFGEICVNLIGSSCPQDEVCLPVEIQNIETPDEIAVTSPLCAGQAGVASVMPNDDIVSYFWDLTNLEEISGNGTPSISYTGSSSGIGTVCLTVETACGFSDPLCEFVEIIDNPAPQLILLSPPCNLDFSVATISSPQTASLSWTTVSGPGSVIFEFPNFPQTSVSVSEPGTYVFMLEENNNGCIGSSIIEVEVLPPIIINSLNFDCNQSQEYTVTLSIAGGQTPYSVNGIPFAGNIFTSDEINSGDPYTFLVSDALNCQIPLVTGTYECLCNTESGTMATEILETCAELGNSVEAAFPTNIILDTGDIGLFYLHTNPGNILGDVLSINSTGIFNFEPPLEAGITYYISFVVGQAQNGDIDLENPCTSVSAGQPIIFYSAPNIELDLPSLICDSNFFVIYANSSGVDSISWEYANGPAALEINISSDTVFFIAPLPGIYEYDLMLSNNFCDTILSVDFEVLQNPEIINVNQDCSLDPAFYNLIFEVNGGESPFTSSLPGVFDDRIFTSTLLDTSLVYDIIIADANGCETSITVNPIDCSCEISLGTIIPDTIYLCQGDNLNPTVINLDDYIFDEAIYDVFYYTYESTSSAIDDFIEFSDGELISQSVNYISGQTYYLRLIISTPNTDISEGLVLDGPCTVVSAPIAFIWREDYQFNFDVHPTVCTLDSTYSFLQLFPGPFPYVVGFSAIDANEILYTIDSTNEIITLPVFEGPTDWELTYFEGNCGFSYMGNFTITGESPTDYQLNSIDTLCNNEFFGSVLVLDQVLSTPVDGIWELEGEEQFSNEINFDGFPAGAYEIVFTSDGDASSCPLKSDTIVIEIIDCICPTATTKELAFCNTIGIIDPSFFVFSVSPGTFSINNTSGFPNPPILIDQDQMDISQASQGTYEIVYELDGEWPSSCQTEFIGTIIVQRQGSSGVATDNVLLCEGDQMTIDLFDLIEDYDTGGNWSNEGLPVNPIIETEFLELGIQSYVYSVSSQAPCESSNTTVNIEVLPKPELEVQTDDVLCFGDSNGTLTIEIINETSGPYICELDGIEQNEKLISGLSPGIYTVVVTDVYGCFTQIDSVKIGEPDVVAIDLGNDLEVFFQDSVTINALLNILESDVGSISWEDLNGFIDNDDLTLIKNAVQNEQITLTITDENGCIATDSVQIRLMRNSILLPNIFVPSSDDPANQRFGMPVIPGVTNVSEFKIYDRWGNNVFEAMDVDAGSEEGYWYGNYNNQPAKQGVYAFIMTYTLITGEEVSIFGDVTLIR